MSDTKGLYNGRCNFTACQSGQPATWWHFSTQKYYCEDCAKMLNNDNRKVAMALLGHDLLVPAFQAVTATSGPSDTELLLESNELLRSCYQVAMRRGMDTNWEPLQKRLFDALGRQHQRTNEIRHASPRGTGVSE